MSNDYYISMKDYILKAYRIYHEEGLYKLSKSMRIFIRERRQQILGELIGRKTVVHPQYHFKYNTYINSYINNITHDAPADPFEPIDIDPRQVNYVAQKIERNKGLNQVVSGKWDTRQHLRPIEEIGLVRGLRQRFVEGKDWEDTVYYTERKKDLERGSTVEGYNDPENYLEIRCKFVDQLFESIRDEGYRPNFKANHEVPEQGARNNAKSYLHELEPLVAIGRAGEIYLREGYHRLTIARILGIQSIPVNVIARHSTWQEQRDRIQNTKSANLRNHPDLQDVL